MRDNKYVSRVDAAAFLGVSLRSIDRYAKQGRLQKYVSVNSVFFLREDLDAVLLPRPQ